jgi:hypothetical protein
VHRPADIEIDPVARASARDAVVLMQVGRLNQSLLALIDALEPGTVDSMTMATTDGAAART